MKIKDVLIIKKPAPKHAERGMRFLGSRPAIHAVLRSGLRGSRKTAAWIALDSDSANMLLDEVQTFKAGAFGTLVLLASLTPSKFALANRYFRTVCQPGLHWLPAEQVVRILHLPEPRDRIVCGLVDKEAGNLLVFRGDLQPIVAPLASFQTRANVEPNFDDFEVIDWGNAVRFGRYEASADAVLYENDPEYRRRLKKRRRAQEKTFGASLRRLRLQKNVRQSDFAPQVSAKTIARLENHQVCKPHGQTLAHIAERLGVRADEIESY